MAEEDIVAQHHNKPFPCPFGCHYDEYRTGELRLSGDCRVPESHRCWLQQEATTKRLIEEANTNNE